MRWFYDLIVVTHALPGFIWFRTKRIYEGGKRVRLKGGALTIANHVGYFDPIYLMYAIPYRRQHFVCAQEILSSPFRAWFLKMAMCIPIDRKNMSMESFREIVDVMKKGGMVTMFPEGHIEQNGEKEKFKSGMVLMAVQAHVPILPVAITKRKHFWNRLRVAVGQPIDIEALYGPRPSFRQVDEIAELLYNKELELQQLLEG